MVIAKDMVEQVKNRMSRRGFSLEESGELLKSKQGGVLLPKKRIYLQGNLTDQINRFC